MAKRPIRIEGDTAYITLTRGYTATIDASDAHLASEWSWSALVNRRAVYAVRVAKSKGAPQRMILLHRVISCAPPEMSVDHIDGDSLNNRRSNLRIATTSQNGMNRGAQSNSRSGVKGVSFNERDRVWVARIMAGGEDNPLGSFGCITAAAMAYAKASARLHGEFSRLA